MKTTVNVSAVRARGALLALIGAVSLASTPVAAAPDDIRVTTDGLTDPGDFAMELYAASVRARHGSATRHLGQGLAELSYGLSQTFEVSVQLPMSLEPSRRANGANIEFQYVAPHDEQSGPYWGIRMELGRTREPFEPQMTSSLEFRPILGYRFGLWHAVLNAALQAPLTGSERKVTWEPSTKIARDVGAKTQAGLEYYVQSAQRPDGVEGSLARRKLGLVVLDTKVQGIAFGVGVGRGMGPGADGRVVKLIAGFEL